MDRAAYDQLVTMLTGDGPPRVWSFLVTVFGDLAQAPGDDISGPLLHHLCALIGIRPEAVRVALHRLRRDGWIDSRRQGRTGHHFLTQWGRAQSAAASPRIYAADQPGDAAWIVIRDAAATGQEAGVGLTPIAPQTFLSARPETGGDALVLPLDPSRPAPEWLIGKLCGDETAALARRFDAGLIRLEGAADRLAQVNPLEQAALRVLIVHEWRRIVLKTPLLPDFVFPAGWAGADCRRRVAHLLGLLPRPALGALEASVPR